MRRRAKAKASDLEEQFKGEKCSVPHCEQDGISRFGYCGAHAKMPYHVGKILHIRPRPESSRETESKTIAEVDLARSLVRFEGERSWYAPKSLVTQTGPTPQDWLEATEERGPDGLYRAPCSLCQGFGHFSLACPRREDAP